MAEALRRYLAPVVIAGSLAALGIALAQPHPAPSTRDPFHTSGPSAGTAPTTSSPYWTLPPTSTTPGNPQVAMDAVQWTQVAYPGACGNGTPTTMEVASPGGNAGTSPSTLTASTGFTVDQVSFVQPDPSDQLAVVLVHCGGGTAPAGLFVYGGAQSVTQPNLIQTLVPESQDVFAGSFSYSYNGSHIAIQVQSGAPDRTGACCAGLTYTLSWSWSRGSYRAG